VRVRVRLFGRLQRFSAPETPGRLELEIAPGAAVRDLIDILKPGAGEVANVAINGRSCTFDQRIADGDEVYLLNMLGGG
jgi:molybdopterin converting factor small subunit